jgi:hypothetical protein
VRHIDFLDEQIEQLTGMIEEQIGPFDPAVEPRCTITAIQRRGAEPIVGEIGVDTTCFRSPRHLASWAGQCPGNDKSAGKRRSGKTRNGSKWLDFALKEAAMAAIRVKGHSPEAQYRRLKPRRGHKHALGAVKHPILGAIWHMLVTGETHRDLGGDHFTNRDPERQTRRLVNSSNASDTTQRSRRGPRQPERTFPTRANAKVTKTRPGRPLPRQLATTNPRAVRGCRNAGGEESAATAAAASVRWVR